VMVAQESFFIVVIGNSSKRVCRHLGGKRGG
jgi:hypothetical protein